MTYEPDMQEIKATDEAAAAMFHRRPPVKQNPFPLLDKFAELIDLNEADISTIWFALRSYLDTLKANLASQYESNPDFGIEDEMFLGGTIGQVAGILFRLEQAGFKERYKV